MHNTESIYGILVSLDDKAALVRANFIEGRLDHRRTFTEINERVIAPFEKGWIGALIKGKDPLKPDQVDARRTIEVVYRGTAGRRTPGSRRATSSTSVNGDRDRRTASRWREIIGEIRAGAPRSRSAYKRGDDAGAA